MTAAKRSGPPSLPSPRTNLMWGLASYMLVGLGAIVASIHALPLGLAISLGLAGAISLIVRAAAFVTIALLRRRSAHRSGRSSQNEAR
jgi:hypothetical protein